MRAVCGLVLLGMAVVQAAAPPARTRELTAQEQKVVAALVQRLNERAKAGAFEEALGLAQQIARYRQERQGNGHWQTIDARLEVEQWQRLTRVSHKDRAAVVRATGLNEKGLKLQERGRYREALPLLRKALEIHLETLGQAHPATAQSYHDVALCHHHLGKAREALPLFRKALEIRLLTLGEVHPDTATSHGSVAFCLKALGKAGEALPLYRKAWKIHLQTLGEAHPHSAQSCNNVADCLTALGKSSEALPLFRKVLEVLRKTLGEDHPHTASTCNNLALCLNDLGRPDEALPLQRKALEICRKTLGEAHANTALARNNVAFCLIVLGKPAEALPLFRKALKICLESLGEAHPLTILSYDNVAMCLKHLGKAGEALPLLRKALQMRLETLGETHPDTTVSCNNVANCLIDLDRPGEALPLARKALEIRLESLGQAHRRTVISSITLALCLDHLGKAEEALPLYRKVLQIDLQTLGQTHPETASACNNLAACLSRLGKQDEALLLYRKALGIRLEKLGEAHPDSATSYGNAATCLMEMGKASEALLMNRKALEIRRKTLGETHPHTATSYSNLALCLWIQARQGEALRLLQAALPGLEASRFHAAVTGFDRAVASGRRLSSHALLALGLARLGQPRNAFQYAEASLARGLLDDLAAGSGDRQHLEDLAVRLAALEARLLPLLGVEKPTVPQHRLLEELLAQRRSLSTRLEVLASDVSARRLLPLEQIQDGIPSGAALVLWLDIDRLGEHRACIVRRQGSPVWVTLPGSGSGGTWTTQDSNLVIRLSKALADRGGEPGQLQQLLEAFHKQRLAPLAPHLKGVRHLLVVPSGQMASVPVEALTQEYIVSYTPSGSALARLMQKHRPLQGSSALVLADANFQRPQARPPAAPSHGLLIASITPGSLAARVGLRAGDVLLQHDGKRLNRPTDFKEAAGDGRVAVRLWREGRILSGQIPSGKLGLTLDSRPVAEALAAWRGKQTRLLASLSRGDEWQALPGTRLEAAALRGLVPSATLLLGSDASEQRLRELAATGKFSSYRLLHLASHGEASSARPEQTALILAQDRLLPGSAAGAQDVLAGKKPLDGRLTVGTVLETWKLNADLVVLSACQSGLGKKSGGEGMLGFAHALLAKGAHSVVLSRWKVDDSATALLMARFYENLLQRKLKRAEALHEAKRWLRELPRAEAEKRLAKLLDAVPSAERGKVKRALPTRKSAGSGEERPFAAPYFWAAFVLIGDPD
jgi:tetratricopeptide (TPR) repeat protein